MGLVLILGPNNSGKSLFAEKLAVEKGGPRVYLATMVPQTEENYKRIDKHRIQREGKGFMTIEESWNIADLDIHPEAVVLLEDVSNLLANGMFGYGANGKETISRIIALEKKCKCMILVSIAGLIGEGYDEETTRYIDELNWVNYSLAQLADDVYKMQDGVLV